MPTGFLMAKEKKPGKKSGGKKKTPQANVKLAADLVHKLGVISQWRQRSISAILDPQIRPFIETEFQLVAKEMSDVAHKAEGQVGGDSGSS